ncbi:Pkinase-domain-containing protein [Salix suchowensis]|nr:Pkinase-domain-containing protein [Salix suchowensis]
MDSLDVQALDLLATSKAIVVNLRRTVRYYNSPSPLNKSDVLWRELSEDVGRAVWWPSVRGRGDDYIRYLEGEIQLAKDLKPSASIAHFSVSYSVVICPFDSPGFISSTTEPLHSEPVEIATMYARGPKPRSYAPPHIHAPHHATRSSTLLYGRSLEPSPTMSNCWGYSLRGNDFPDDQDEDDDAPNDPSTKNHLPNETDMLNDLDLSTREEAAEDLVDLGRWLGISRRARRPIRRIYLERGHQFLVKFLQQRESRRALASLRTYQSTTKPTAVRPHIVLEGYHQRKPAGRPNATNRTVTGPRLPAQSFPLPSATNIDKTTSSLQPGFEDAPTAVMLSTDNPQILSTNRLDCSSLVPLTSVIPSGQLSSPHVSPAPPPRNLLPQASGYNSPLLLHRMLKDSIMLFSLLPSPVSQPKCFQKRFCSAGKRDELCPPNLLPLPPSSPLLPSSPLPIKSPTLLYVVENSAPVKSRKRNLSPHLVRLSRSAPRRIRTNICVLLKKPMIRPGAPYPREPASVFKTSGAFRLPSKFRPTLTGVDANVKKSGMSADSTRRVVTFLPPPMVAPQKPTNEGAERSQLAYPSPTHANFLTANNRPVDRSPQPAIRAMQYPPSRQRLIPLRLPSTRPEK